MLTTPYHLTLRWFWKLIVVRSGFIMKLCITCLAILILGDSMANSEMINASFERTITKKVGLKYALFLPDGYNTQPEKSWPLILFLHGSGSRGDNLKFLTQGRPMTYAQQTRDFPFILVAPQCPDGEQWESDTLIALLDEIETKYHIDQDRVYLTGISMGGTGTWTLAIDHPERFAAIAPVCGRVILTLAYRIKDMPIWVFHGDKDNTVNISFSVDMIAKLKSEGAKNVEFTIYPGAGHSIGDTTYSNPKLYEWFLAHKRKHN